MPFAPLRPTPQPKPVQTCAPRLLRQGNAQSKYRKPAGPSGATLRSGTGMATRVHNPHLTCRVRFPHSCRWTSRSKQYLGNAHMPKHLIARAQSPVPPESNPALPAPTPSPGRAKGAVPGAGGATILPERHEAQEPQVTRLPMPHAPPSPRTCSPVCCPHPATAPLREWKCLIASELSPQLHSSQDLIPK